MRSPSFDGESIKMIDYGKLAQISTFYAAGRVGLRAGGRYITRTV
jgi:hypothetical protein